MCVCKFIVCIVDSCVRTLFSCAVATVRRGALLFLATLAAVFIFAAFRSLLPRTFCPLRFSIICAAPFSHALPFCVPFPVPLPFLTFPRFASFILCGVYAVFERFGLACVPFTVCAVSCGCIALFCPILPFLRGRGGTTP